MHQYYGQYILRVTSYKLAHVGQGGWNLNHPDFYIELTSLSAITNEDAKEVGKLNGSVTSDDLLVGHALVHWLDKKSTNRDIPFEAVDFLRSRGYALPWMGVSVEQQIEWGWIKIKQDGNR